MTHEKLLHHQSLTVCNLLFYLFITAVKMQTQPGEKKLRDEDTFTSSWYFDVLLETETLELLNPTAVHFVFPPLYPPCVLWKWWCCVGGTRPSSLDIFGMLIARIHTSKKKNIIQPWTAQLGFGSQMDLYRYASAERFLQF